MQNTPSEHSIDHVHGATQKIAEFRWGYHSSRYDQLASLTSGATEGVWQYLLAVNGGAVAGMIGFIGAVPAYRREVWSYAALTIFVLGLVIVGIARAHWISKTNSVFLGWIDLVDRYYSGEIRWSEVILGDRENSERQAKIPWALGWLSFILFLSGLFVVALAFWKIGVHELAAK